MAADSLGHTNGLAQSAAMIVLAITVATLVILYAPPGGQTPTTTTASVQTIGCGPDDALCRAVELLEDLRHDPTLTPREQEAVATASEGVSDLIGGETAPTTAVPPPPSSQPTTTTTTTTVPVVHRPPADVAADIRDDLTTPTTEADDGGG